MLPQPAAHLLLCSVAPQIHLGQQPPDEGGMLLGLAQVEVRLPG
jgi:hypothetical protein